MLQKKEYNTWQNLKEALLEFDEKAIFRGHKCSNWYINSSLERCFENFDITSNDVYRSYYISAIEALIPSGVFTTEDYQRFVNSVNKYEFHIVNEPLPPNEALPIMEVVYNTVFKLQHFGLPTHLIDFSRSFLVALYFALLDSFESCNSDKGFWPCVISAQYPEFENDEKIIFKKFSIVDKCPKYVCDRISNQQGQFITIDEREQYDYTSHQIDTKWIPEIYSELVEMGITGFKLFGSPEKSSLDFYNMVKYSNKIDVIYQVYSD